jgi:PAS domain S-box-containing protein
MAWTALPDGSNEFVNRRWLEYTGFSQEETAGSGWQAAVHPEDLARHAESWRVSVAAGQVFEDEVRFRRAADGEYRWFLVRGVPQRDRHGNILKWYGIIADIEDRKRVEEERQRLRQLEADLAHINRVSILGELSASIAHEVNQPLAGVVSNGNACLRWLGADIPNVEEARENARRIIRDGKRAAEVIARIRALTKRAATARESLDLNDTIQDVLALIADEAKKESVIIRTQFADEL